MNDGSAYQIPKNVDSPLPFFAWEMTEVVLAMIFLCVGIVFQQFLAGMIGSIFILYLSRKMRGGRKRGQVQHVIWRLGVGMVDPAMKKYGPPPMRLEYMR